jgi:hypothetical protein
MKDSRVIELLDYIDSRSINNKITPLNAADIDMDARYFRMVTKKIDVLEAAKPGNGIHLLEHDGKQL